MDMKIRKILRDFINWQGSKGLLKNELTIDYELAETYLEETKKQLFLCDVVVPKGSLCGCGAELIKDAVGIEYCGNTLCKHK